MYIYIFLYLIHSKEKILSYSFNVHDKLNFSCLLVICNFFTNQPHNTYQNLTNSGRKKTNPDSYAMPIVTNDIFSPPPSNWLRPEVKMTIPESCEMQKKKLCQVRFSIFSKLYQSVFHWFQIDFFIILQTFVCAAIFNKIFMLHFWTSLYKTELLSRDFLYRLRCGNMGCRVAKGGIQN